MSLFLRFKKDYFNYLISIILPAFIAGISVPVFKHLLGANGYGNFSIYYNAVLIFTAITTGWITQSIFRFYPTSNDKALFARLSVDISCISQIVCFLPVLFFAWYQKNDLVFGVMICLSLFVISMQLISLATAQSSFLSKKTIYSETIRAVCYIVVAVVLLLFTGINYLYVLFIAVIASFTLSVIYLRRQTRDFFLQNKGDGKAEELTLKKLARRFFKYGTPLSTWVVFAYLLSYIDKILILKNFGAQMQGNYQAIFDLLSRGITLLISPVTISLFPLLTLAYEKGEIMEIKKLLGKIILFELGGFVLAGILYWLFGAKLLFIILKIPDTRTYWLMGFIVISGTFIWQLAMVLHQRYVLKMKSLFLLFMIIVAFLVQAIFYWIFNNYGNPLLYPFGYLLSAIVYLFCVSFSELPALSRVVVAPIRGFLTNRDRNSKA